MRQYVWSAKIASILLSLGVARSTGDSSSSSSPKEGYRPSTWYKRYDAYPPYCSTPADMYERQIPRLRDRDRLIGETRLVHLTAVIRHGARTPWSSQNMCWEGYWNASSDTSRWDCDLTTVMAPPDPNAVAVEEDDTSHWLPDDAFFLYEKFYDALNSEEDGALKNELNGTCQVGQMLLQGYAQQIGNGRILRVAYGYEENDYSHDERMRLFDLSYEYSFFDGPEDKQTPWGKSHLYFRADDDQRTVMSGQVLLRGLFDKEVTEKFVADGTYPNIQLHIADRERDVLGANFKTCPRLNEVKSAAFSSKEFQKFNSSDKINSVRWYAKDKLGASNGVELLDCLMTTICTDRDLPIAVNDYDSSSSDGSMFEALAEADIMSYNLIMKHNNSEFAKLAMGPLWAEIMENINPYLEQSDPSGGIPAPRFALFSGHDTTVMPLLASIDPGLWNDTDWAPYASMMLIEIHELIDGISDKAVYTTDFAFRLLFNGKILTSFVPGCPAEAELCDAAVLKNLIDPIATRVPDCTLRHPNSPVPTSSKEAITKAQTLLTTTEGVLMFLGLVVFGVLAGGIGTFVLLTGRLPFSKRQVLDTTEVDEDREARQGLQARTSYFDDECDDDLSEEGEQDFARASLRVEAISTGLR